MNKTKSGAYAVGSEMSDSRMITEAEFAINNNIRCLWQTKEGLFLLNKFQDNFSEFDKLPHYLAEDLLLSYLLGVCALT